MKAHSLVFCYFIVGLFSIQSVYGQSSTQTWIEYRPTYKFNDAFKLGMRTSYRTNYEDPHWHTWEIRFMPEYKLTKHLNVLASAQYLQTRQTHFLTTREIRMAVGARLFFVPGKRFESGLFGRIEFRNQYKFELDEWAYTTRYRLRAFASMPITKHSMKDLHVIYGTFFAEIFYQDDQEVQERFASRGWIRAGLGYRINHNLQFELQYNWQESKNTINDKISHEGIVLFVLKQSLQRTNKKQ